MDIGKLKAEPGTKFRLEKFAPNDTYGVSKNHAEKAFPRAAPLLRSSSPVHANWTTIFFGGSTPQCPKRAI
jgi:hypothetical protein